MAREARLLLHVFLEPVARHIRLESVELEVQPWVSRGDQVMVDIPQRRRGPFGGRADVAARAGLHTAGQVGDRNHALLPLLLRRSGFPVWTGMFFQPILGSAMAR